MSFEEIPLNLLSVNRANDRHGELENETAAIAELFRLRESHMKNLAEDITNEAAIYDPPLVEKTGNNYVAYDGNRRITCLKLISSPEKAPSQKLRDFFEGLQKKWVTEPPTTLMCQVESDRDRIDAIIFRRHTGAQGGIGQSRWDDRAKKNFVERTGRGNRVNVADKIEDLLTEEKSLPTRTIPRSTLNRLLSSEALRERVGISVRDNQFHLTHHRPAVVRVLAHIADDLANRRIVLDDVWDNDRKTSYLNRLEGDGLLPTRDQLLPNESPRARPKKNGRKSGPASIPKQTTFVPIDVEAINWDARQIRLRSVWGELQTLKVHQHPNAVSALMRILIELAVESYLEHRSLKRGDNLSQNIGAAAKDLLNREAIDQHYFDELERLRRHDELISVKSMQRFIHSQNFAPAPQEIITYWNRLGEFLIAISKR